MGIISGGFDRREFKDAASVKRIRLIYLAAAVLSLLVLGLLYAWSIFAVPLASAFGWDRSSLSYVFSISMVAFCLGGFISSFVTTRTSVNFTIMLSALFLAAGFLLTSLFAATGIWALYLFYGVFAGLGCGFGYNTIISTVNLWFFDRVGISSGIMLMGFGLGSLVLGTAANAAIEAFGWSFTFLLIAGIGAVIVIGFSLLIRLPPSNLDELLQSEQKAKPSRRVKIEPEDRKIYTAPIFYVYFIWGMFILCAGLTLIGDVKLGAIAVGVDAADATLLVGSVSLASGISRVLIGLIFDKAGLKTAMALINCVAIIAIGLLAYSFSATLPALYIGAALLVGAFYGGMPVVASALARERFRASEYARNLATINLNVACAAFLSSGCIALGRAIGGDVTIYLIIMGLILVSLVLMLVFFRMYYRPRG